MLFLAYNRPRTLKRTLLTEDLKQDYMIEVPREDPISNDSKEDLLLMTLERTLSLRNLKGT